MTQRVFRAGTNSPGTGTNPGPSSSSLDLYLAAKAAGVAVAHHSGCRCSRPVVAAATSRGNSSAAIPPAPSMSDMFKRTPASAPPSPGSSTTELPTAQRPMREWFPPTSKK